MRQTVFKADVYEFTHEQITSTSRKRTETLKKGASLSEQIVHDFAVHVGETEIAARGAEGELLVVEA